MIEKYFQIQENQKIYELVLYFLLITGPVLSPKYIFPILPCLFLYQGITLFKFVDFFKKQVVGYFRKN